jgi:hypothetical protein
MTTPTNRTDIGIAIGAVAAAIATIVVATQKSRCNGNRCISCDREIAAANEEDEHARQSCNHSHTPSNSPHTSPHNSPSNSPSNSPRTEYVMP